VGVTWARTVLVLSVASCTSGPPPLDTDTQVPREACDWRGDPVLDVVPYALPDGCPADGLPVGTPPQGGAPYLPLRMRLHADLSDDVVRVQADGEARAAGQVVGEESVQVAALCANAGTDVGWYLLGELHLRFSGAEQATLEGLDLDVSLDVVWDGGQQTITLAGPACWSL